MVKELILRKFLVKDYSYRNKNVVTNCPSFKSNINYIGKAKVVDQEMEINLLNNTESRKVLLEKEIRIDEQRYYSFNIIYNFDDVLDNSGDFMLVLNDQDEIVYYIFLDKINKEYKKSKYILNHNVTDKRCVRLFLPAGSYRIYKNINNLSNVENVEKITRQDIILSNLMRNITTNIPECYETTKYHEITDPIDITNMKIKLDKEDSDLVNYKINKKKLKLTLLYFNYIRNSCCKNIAIKNGRITYIQNLNKIQYFVKNPDKCPEEYLNQINNKLMSDIKSFGEKVKYGISWMPHEVEVLKGKIESYKTIDTYKRNKRSCQCNW